MTTRIDNHQENPSTQANKKTAPGNTQLSVMLIYIHNIYIHKNRVKPFGLPCVHCQDLNLIRRIFTRKAYPQDEYYVLKWMVEDFKKIKRYAKEQGVEIYFGVECTVRSDYHSGTTVGSA